MLTGNREYNEIYEEYKNLVLQVAYFYSGKDYHAAEDIAQDILLKLYEGFEDFDKEKIKPWLIVVTRNAALNYRKKMSKEYLSEDYDAIAESELMTASIEEDYMEDVQSGEAHSLHSEIMEALMNKSQKWYEAVILAYYVKMPQNKVAERMGMSLQVLHSTLHRAKDWIRKKYGAEYDEMNRK